MTDVVWRVVVAREIDEEAEQELTRVGATHISGHSGPGYSSSSLLVTAEDEEGARRKIEDALGPHAFIREAVATPVYVYAPIGPELKAAFQNAAGEDVRVGGVIEDENTGELEAYFELLPGDVERAFNEARGIYSRISSAAGAQVPEPLEMTMSGFETLMFNRSQARERLGHAGDLLAGDEPELSVVVAQTACEVLIKDVLLTLARPHVSDELWPWVVGRVRRFTLIDDPTQELWQSVVGSKIQQQPFWSEYSKHVNRRHRIVHAGETTTVEDARASLRSAREIIDYVESATGAAPLPQTPARP